MSRIAAGLAIAVSLPLLLAISLAVWMSLGAPILFRQTRSGKGGGNFTLVKFRTMHNKLDGMGRPLPDEERVTAIGKLLRRTRLDELPGLWNVAAGDLAFIGPRPLLPQTMVILGSKGEARGKVKPGITGWAQTNGNTLLSLSEKVDLDLWYIEHQNWRLDGKIILRTIRLMICGERLNEGATQISAR